MSARKRPLTAEADWHSSASAHIAECLQIDDIVTVQKQLSTLQKQATERLCELRGGAGNHDRDALAAAQRALQGLLIHETTKRMEIIGSPSIRSTWRRSRGIQVCAVEREPRVPALTQVGTCTSCTDWIMSLPCFRAVEKRAPGMTHVFRDRADFEANVG